VQLLLITAVGCTIAALFLGIGGGALKMMGRNSTLTGRTDIWNIVIGLAGNPFLGTGFESFWLGDRLQAVWRDYGLHIQEAHNGYLEVYLNLGWIGVALLALLMVTAYQNVMRALREKQETGSLMLAFLLAAVLYSFTEAGFRMMSPIWTAFLLVATSVPKGLVPDVSVPDRLPELEVESTLVSSPYEPEFDPVTSLVPKEDNF
jgi:O-antigen ligase